MVFYFGTKNGNIGDVWITLRSADPYCIAGAFLCWVFFVLFEALVMHCFLHFQHIPIPFGISVNVTLIGLFYSNITPGATGGQPMQVYALRKRGISGGYASSGLAVKFFCYQTALILLSGILWFCNRRFVSGYFWEARWFVYLGFFLNGLTVVGVILIGINRNIVRGIVASLLYLGKKLHLIRDYTAAASRVDAALDDFHSSIYLIARHPLQLLLLLFLSGCELIALMSVIYFVALALGITSCSYGELVTLQFLLQIGASFTPLPGASGAQEGGFYLFFQSIFPADKLLGALLIWRFFTYYLSTLLSLCFGVVTDSVQTIRGRLRKVPTPSGTKSSEGDGIE